MLHIYSRKLDWGRNLSGKLQRLTAQIGYEFTFSSGGRRVVLVSLTRRRLQGKKTLQGHSVDSRTSGEFGETKTGILARKPSIFPSDTFIIAPRSLEEAALEACDGLKRLHLHIQHVLIVS